MSLLVKYKLSCLVCCIFVLFPDIKMSRLWNTLKSTLSGILYRFWTFLFILMFVDSSLVWNPKSPELFLLRSSYEIYTYYPCTYLPVLRLHWHHLSPNCIHFHLSNPSSTVPFAFIHLLLFLLISLFVGWKVPLFFWNRNPCSDLPSSNSVEF